MTKIANFDTGDVRQSGGISVGSGAGGDLSGGYPAPTVVGLGGIPLSGATPDDDDVLTYDSGAGTWGPEPGGAAGSFVETFGGGGEDVVTIADLGASYAIDITAGNLVDATLTEDCDLSGGFLGATNGVADSWTLWLRQDGTGGWDVTAWPSSVVGAGGTAPTLDTTASTLSELVFVSTDGGTSWLGHVVGGGGGGTFSTTDGSVTVDPTTQLTFTEGGGITLALADLTGGVAELTFTVTATGGEILISDTPAGSPLVFADLLQNDAGDDLLYSNA
jgi:hypothetical protein